jgi:hypothetical protein
LKPENAPVLVLTVLIIRWIRESKAPELRDAEFERCPFMLNVPIM